MLVMYERTAPAEPQTPQGSEGEDRAWPGAHTAHSTPVLPAAQPSDVAAASSEPGQASGIGHGTT